MRKTNINHGCLSNWASHKRSRLALCNLVLIENRQQLSTNDDFCCVLDHFDVEKYLFWQVKRIVFSSSSSSRLHIAVPISMYVWNGTNNSKIQFPGLSFRIETRSYLFVKIKWFSIFPGFHGFWITLKPWTLTLKSSKWRAQLCLAVKVHFECGCTFYCRAQCLSELPRRLGDKPLRNPFVKLVLALVQRSIFSCIGFPKYLTSHFGCCVSYNEQTRCRCVAVVSRNLEFLQLK